MFSKFDVDAIIFFNSHCYIIESAILFKIAFGGVLLLASNLLQFAACQICRILRIGILRATTESARFLLWKFRCNL